MTDKTALIEALKAELGRQASEQGAFWQPETFDYSEADERLVEDVVAFDGRINLQELAAAVLALPGYRPSGPE